LLHHAEVLTELQPQLSRRNPRQATEQELTSNNRTTLLNNQANIRETSPTTNMSVDYSQTAFSPDLRMPNLSPHSLDNLQDLTLGLEPESAQIPTLPAPFL